MAKPLQILNASAGSGKTYNLVLTYLKMILGEGQTPSTFSKIMAMTFTNKAAHEMKSRIISALDSLANPVRKTEKETEKSQSYLTEVSELLKTDPGTITQRAKTALKLILHQYEDFHVMTIDKFNLRLIRSFALDLNLEADFKVVLKEDEVLDKVIDQLMDELDVHDQQYLTQLILSYSREKIANSEKWNFEKDLKEFAKILTKENYNSILSNFKDFEYSKENYSFLKLEINRVKESITDEADRLLAVFSTYSPDELKGKSVTVNAYNKLKTEYLFEGNSQSGGFFTPALYTKIENGELPDKLCSASIAFETFYKESLATYSFLQLVLKNFYNMALLKFISDKLDHIRADEQLIRISEFNTMISELIKDEEAPFIYERIGNRFQHFLLDEFQDTSRLQWMNIVPLLHESLAGNHSNLIVGDPKQSIYRFKNGLAEQFVALPEIYNPEQDADIARKSGYFATQGEKIPLNDNWRSSQEIVQFNNLFFQTLSGLPELSFEEFYRDVHQHPKGPSGGFIAVTMRNNCEQEEEESKKFMLDAVQECIDDGTPKGNICILGYSKRECNDWAIALTELGHKVVSADSLMVDFDKTVKLAVSYLKWRKNPAGELEARFFAERYFALKDENTISSVKKYWKTKNTSGKEYKVFDRKSFLTDQFGSEEAFFSPYENLFALGQHFCNLSGVHEIQNPYLHHLSDLLFDFDQQRGPDLDAFLEYYESEGYQSAIQIPENDDAIKIMTGHKSKGLEFPVVILPTMNWNIRKKDEKHLLRQDNHYIYHPLSKTSKVEMIRLKYEEEFRQSILDKLNLCYVMMTRPVERLYIGNFTEKKDNSKFGFYFNEALSNTDFSGSGANMLSVENDELIFTIGTRQQNVSATAADNSDKEFIPSAISDHLWFPDISLQDDVLRENNILSDYQRYGNQLHYLMSIVHSPEEIDQQIDLAVKSGIVEDSFIDRLSADLFDILNYSEYSSLTSNAHSILNEQEIIAGTAETKRPDKIIIREEDTIVIDYKTGMPDKRYDKQVQEYVALLRSMEFKNVKGYVFYTSDLKLIHVA